MLSLSQSLNKLDAMLMLMLEYYKCVMLYNGYLFDYEVYLKIDLFIMHFC